MIRRLRRMLGLEAISELTQAVNALTDRVDSLVTVLEKEHGRYNPHPNSMSHR